VSKIFSRRMVWRDLAYWQLYHWPDMPSQPIRTAYLDQEWGMPSRDADKSLSDTQESEERSADAKRDANNASSSTTSSLTSKELLRAWQRGCTGYPVIDAAMRQLWKTGWIHQNSRMVGALFIGW
jgi:deoxyribodipyrimidine photolyase